MNRRTFIKLSSLALAGILTQSCDSTSDKPNPQAYKISIKSDMRAGHLILDSARFANREHVLYGLSYRGRRHFRAVGGMSTKG